MNRGMMQLGFVLVLVALVTAFAIPAAANPRMMLAAHTVGILGGLALVVVGMLAGSFALGTRSRRVLMWSWVYATWANWLGCLIAGLTGASRLTPIAGAGMSGTVAAEGVVAFIFLSEAAAALVAAGLSVWGLRREAEAVAVRPWSGERVRGAVAVEA
jgi:(hydroxyamino)benzene mutase